MNYISYTHIGKKQVNEDYLSITQQSLIVCDGVGGEVKGNRASKEVTEFLVNNLSIEAVDKTYLQDLISNSHNHINNILEEEPELEGMATTLAALFLTKNGFYSAHLGDSRIYIVRPKENKFWQTWDHSLVGNLVKNQEITREQARSHPMNNQINRAIKANSKGKLSKPEIHFINDLRKGDVLFICSDGISEAFSDLDLLELLANTEMSIDDKLTTIKEKSSDESFDNNTAIIAELEKTDLPKGTIIPLKWTPILQLKEEAQLDTVDIQVDNEKPTKKKRWFRFFK